MKRFATYGIYSAVIWFTIGCGSDSDSDKETVTGKVSIRMGATTGTGFHNKQISPKLPAIADGNWALSPDKAKVTFTKISFADKDGESTEEKLSDCSATYDRSKVSGAEILKCSVDIPTGDITNMKVYYSSTFEVQITDATNNIYTSNGAPTKFTNTLPAGGSQFVSLTQSGQDGDFVADINFETSVEVADGSTPTLSIVTDMIHTILATAVSGTLTFDTSLPVAPVSVFATLNSATGKSEVYSTQNTVENVNLGSITGGASDIRVYYISDTVAGFVSHGYIQNCAEGNYPTQASSANPTSAVVQDSGYKVGGFLGLDSAGNISWALPESFNYAKYRSMITLKRTTTLATAVELKCAFSSTNALTIIPPISGNTYASGAPAFTPTQAGLMYQLIAK